jgi:hypothetical protein
VKSYQEFISEGKKGPTPAGNVVKTDNVTKVGSSTNLADETLENLRRKLLDKYLGKIDGDDEEGKETINKCVSTFIYCLDKKLRIDSDIIDLLAHKMGKDSDEISKELTKEVEDFYGSSPNHYGMA